MDWKAAAKATGSTLIFIAVVGFFGFVVWAFATQQWPMMEWVGWGIGGLLLVVGLAAIWDANYEQFVRQHRREKERKP